MKPLKPSSAYAAPIHVPPSRLPALDGSGTLMSRRAASPVERLRPPGRVPGSSSGLLGLLERGAIRPDVDLEPMLTTEGPMQSRRVPLHAAKERHRKPRPVMTERSGYGAVRDYKLDVEVLVRIPATLHLGELKDWEAAQVQQRRAAPETALVAVSSEIRKPITAGSSTAPPATPGNDTAAAAAGIAVKAAAREDTRTYTELLDLYSMHEFIIRKGTALRSTPEFASFKRHYSASWGEVEGLIETLESILTTYGVELAYIDGKRLAQLASFQAPDLVIAKDLVSCISNAEEVLPLLKDASRALHFGPRRYHIAAQKIQATWRMYMQRIAYIHLLIGTSAAITIQRQWATYCARCVTRRTIRALRDTQLARWQQTMEDFKADWPRLETVRRTVVHIPSLSYPVYQSKRLAFFEARQLGQLPRLSMLVDPFINIVFVVPQKPSNEVVQYYQELLEGSGVTNFAGRVTFLVPENASRLPGGVSLTRMALLSPRLLRLLSSLCVGRPAYIIPGVVGAEELSLASQLNLPLLSAKPSLVQAYGAKSGCRRLLEVADVLTPPGATQLRTGGDLLHTLARLITKHRDIARWLIKLENEFGSRGHASLDVSGLRCLRKEEEGAGTADLRTAVRRELEEHGSRRIRVLHDAAFPDWESYLRLFDSVGGVIEAVPLGTLTPITAHLFLAPNGEVRVESVVEPLLAPPLTVMGSRHPCSPAVPLGAVRAASLSLGQAAVRKRIMGYLSVDFVLSTAADASQRLYGVDVDFGLSTFAAAHGLAAVVSGAMWDRKQGTCILPSTKTPLAYAYSGILHSSYISAIRHDDFFSLCQSRGLTYDCDRRAGIIFHFLDVLLCNCFGVLSVGTDEARVVQRLTDFQLLFDSQLPKQGDGAGASNCVYFATLVRQLSQTLRLTDTKGGGSPRLEERGLTEER